MFSTVFSSRSLFRHQRREFPATWRAALAVAPSAFNSRYMVGARFQCLSWIRPQPLTHPLLQRLPDARGLRQPEIGFPAKPTGGRSLSTTSTTLRPPERPVSCLIRCLNVAKSLAATLHVISPLGATQKLKPRNLRPNPRATALMVSLTVKCSCGPTGCAVIPSPAHPHGGYERTGLHRRRSARSNGPRVPVAAGHVVTR